MIVVVVAKGFRELTVIWKLVVISDVCDKLVLLYVYALEVMEIM